MCRQNSSQESFHTTAVKFAESENTVMRKLLCSSEMDWLVALEIPENDEKNTVFLHHYDLHSGTSISSVEYLKLNSKVL